MAACKSSAKFLGTIDSFQFKLNTASSFIDLR